MPALDETKNGLIWGFVCNASVSVLVFYAGCKSPQTTVKCPKPIILWRLVGGIVTFLIAKVTPDSTNRLVRLIEAMV